MRILAIKPSSLGDIVHAAPAIEYLRSSVPDSRIVWVANSEYVGFVRGLAGVDEVVSFPRSAFPRRAVLLWLPRFLAWARRLPAGIEVAVDLQGLFRSGLVSLLSGARLRFVPGDARELGWVFANRRVALPRGLLSARERCLYLAAAVRTALCGPEPNGTANATAGLPERHEDSFESALESARAFARDWRLRPPAEARAFATEALQGTNAPVVALCPGARWESKLWPARHWAALAEALAKASPRVRCILVGGPQDAPLAAAIAALVPGGIDDWVGKASLWESAALLERAAAVVSVDSAPLHVAAAVGTPTVALFGPTDPARVAPPGSMHAVLRKRELPCLECQKRRCPLPERLCLPALEASVVLPAAIQALARNPVAKSP